MSHILRLTGMLDIKVFGGKAGKRKVSPAIEELELRCLRFYTKFLGNWSVSVERKHMKHTFESVSFTKRGNASKGNYVLVSKNRQ